MKSTRNVSLSLGLLVALGFSTNALADCAALGSAVNSTINMGSITVQRDLPVGAEISRKVIPAETTAITGACSTGTFRESGSVNQANYRSLDGTNTYASGINGVGLKLKVRGQYVPSSGYHWETNISTNGSIRYNPEIEVILVKTGDITSGPLALGPLISVAVNATNDAAVTYSLASGNVMQASCEITGSSRIPVAMGEAKMEDFKGKGSTLTPVNINIPLHCDSNAKVNISFAATSSKGDGIIDLTSGGAEGVGIQLKLRDTRVDFDHTLFVAQATEQGNFNIPLSAAYIQTADKIKPGDANAVANFTISYQ
ncbi:type 1 fimbria pilin [Ewingella americana]